MSVIRYGLKEFGAIASTIKGTGELRDRFLNDQEVAFLAKMKDYPITEDELDVYILCFVERLNIANSLAFDYTYNKKEISAISRLEAKDLEGEGLGRKTFYLNLRQLKYNLYTNGGNCFLGEKDMEKLSRLIDYCRDMLENRVEGWEN